MKPITFTFAMAMTWFFALAPCTLGATAAYWRHEEGPAGSLIPDGPQTVVDSSGNGNHMETFSSAFDPYTSATYTTSVSPLPLRSGLPNTLALDFGVGSDGTTPEGLEPNDDNYTTPNTPVSTQLFTAMTVEVAFNMKTVGPGLYQAVFGKDGKPLGDEEGEPNSPVPPFKIVVRGDDFPGGVQNQLFVEWIDGDGDIHFLANGETVTTGNWYHVAFTLSAADAGLWIARETGSYALVDSVSGEDFAGVDGRVVIEDALGFTIGRGFFDNHVADWSDAIIDEVRLSDAVLTPDQFLFVTDASGSADFDGDEDVDGNDFVIWQRNVGRTGTGTPALGDANGDTNVNAADLELWRAQFGGGGVQSIPEPAAWALCVCALSLVGVRRR